MKNVILDIEDRPQNILQWFMLSLQHVFAMMGATILVPLLVGLDPLTALFTAGIGTLLFIVITKAKVPVFLGSSFAFIPALISIGATLGWSYAMGGIFIAGLFYCVIAILISRFGKEWMDRVFPPVVIGAVIISIGLYLAPTAVNMAMNDASGNYSLVSLSIAAVSLGMTIFISIFTKGFFRILPVLGGIVFGYIFTLFMGTFFPAFQIIDFDIIRNAAWFHFPTFVMPQFHPTAIIIFIIVSVATIIEHCGDIYSVSTITGRPLNKDPGIHRTLIGDGLATSLAALFGGVPNTTYGENVGVLSLTKVFSIWVTGGAAVIAVLFSFIGKFGAIIQTIPTPVLGGVCMLLFCLIAAAGLRVIVGAKVDYSNNKNLCITAAVLAPAIGGLAFYVGEFALTGVALGAVLGIIVSLILKPEVQNS